MNSVSLAARTTADELLLVGTLEVEPGASQAKLEELAAEFVDRAMSITKRALETSGFKTGDINEVILVGGQTRMPAMQKAVEDYFGKKANLSVNPDEVVAIGAASAASNGENGFLRPFTGSRSGVVKSSRLPQALSVLKNSKSSLRVLMLRSARAKSYF
mgnify:CR=1 FL=1